jgi:hypothetical protein
MNALTAEKDMQRLCSVLLIASTVVLSGSFACAVPFAALAALAAISTGRRNGVILMGATWLANQAVGFAFLDYPFESSCVGWGLMLGLSAVLGLFAARFATGALKGFSAYLQACAALLFSFFAYEGSLYAATVVTGSSEGAFARPIIADVAVLNAGAFAVLFCFYQALLAAGFLRRSMSQANGRALLSAKPQPV